MIGVSVTNTHRREHCSPARVRHGVRLVLLGEGHRNGSISVVCISDGVSRRMNRTYLRHDYATDVISFSLGEGDVVEGELYVNLDRARVQARRYGVSPARELMRLVIHGTLHLVGFDDGCEDERERMRMREDKYLARLFRQSARKGVL